MVTTLAGEKRIAPVDRSRVEALIQRSWQCMREGRYLESERISKELLQSGMVSSRDVPYFESSTMLALQDSLTGRPENSVPRLLHLLNLKPQDETVQGIFMSVLRKHVSRNGSASLIRKPPGRLIFGLGTGRSGSTTLSYLFGAQKHTYASHEHPPILEWRGSQAQFTFHLRRMSLLSKLYEQVADVSHWWLPRIGEVLRHFPSARFIVVQRDRQETIDSFLRIKGDDSKGTIHHWISHDGSHFRRNLWDRAYPKFQSPNKAQSIGMYWDSYYAAAREAADLYPRHVRIADINDLSDAEKQTEILRFCGFANPVSEPQLHKNQQTISDGRSYWPNPLESTTPQAHPNLDDSQGP